MSKASKRVPGKKLGSLERIENEKEG